MPEVSLESAGDGDDREIVENERADLRQFVEGLSPDDIKSGGWFTKLLAHALSAYNQKATWQYFQEKYAGVPPDAVVDQRIKMAARYAAIEGGLAASAYTAAVSATIGSLGGASPLTVPAALTTVMVDVAFISQLQLRLAHDIAILYRVPLDTSDPDDLWKLIRVAFTIKSGSPGMSVGGCGVGWWRTALLAGGAGVRAAVWVTRTGVDLGLEVPTPSQTRDTRARHDCIQPPAEPAGGECHGGLLRG